MGSGRPAHVPTDSTRKTVQIHTMVGTTQEDVSRILGIDAKTLRRHYREELDLSTAKANASVGGALYNKAIGGDTTAMIFWLKTKAGFREQQDSLTEEDGVLIKIVRAKKPE